jgi:hypothetical protein
MKIRTKQTSCGFTGGLQARGLVASGRLRILMAASLMLVTIGVSSLLAEEGFDNASLHGAYGLNGSGTIGGTSFSTVGRVVLDGRGFCTYVTTMSVGGAPYRPVAATTCAYSVNPEGTGTLTLTLPVLGSGTFAFVLVSDAREVLGIINSPGYIATFAAKKQ